MSNNTQRIQQVLLTTKPVAHSQEHSAANLNQPAPPLPHPSSFQHANTLQNQLNNKTVETLYVHAQGANARQQLPSPAHEYSMQPQGVASNNAKITFEDIDNVIGVNPPLHVIDGYVRRIWKTLMWRKLVWLGKASLL